MRKLLLLSVLLTACEPAGYYVSKVYSANGALVQERCEISGYNHRPDPTACHVEAVTSITPQPAYPAYPPQPQPQQPPPQQPYAPPGY
jgi:hypothetical protein